MALLADTAINIRAYDGNGDPVSGALLSVYNAGTTTPVTVYSDQALTTPITPAANAAGAFPDIYLPAGRYKISVVDPDTLANLPGFPLDNRLVLEDELVSRLVEDRFDVTSASGTSSLTLTQDPGSAALVNVIVQVHRDPAMTDVVREYQVLENAFAVSGTSLSLTDTVFPPARIVVQYHQPLEVPLTVSGTSFQTKAEAIAAGAFADGTTIHVNGRAFVAQAGATAVPDLPGFVAVEWRGSWVGDSISLIAPGRSCPDAQIVEDMARAGGVNIRFQTPAVGGAAYDTALNNFWTGSDGNSADQVDKVEDFDPDFVVVRLGYNDAFTAYDLEGIDPDQYAAGDTLANNKARVQADAAAFYTALKAATNAPILVIPTYVWDRQNGSVATVPDSVTAIPNRLVIPQLHNFLHAADITGITQANPAVVTCSGGHRFRNGETVYIRGAGGMTEVNDRTFTVANRTATTFELSGENSTGHTAYTSGGQAVDPVKMPDGSTAGPSGDNRVSNAPAYFDKAISDLSLDKCKCLQHLLDYVKDNIAAGDSQISIVGEMDLFRIARMGYTTDGLHPDMIGHKLIAANNFGAIFGALPGIFREAEMTKHDTSEIYSQDDVFDAIFNGVDYADNGAPEYDASRVVGGFGRDYIPAANVTQTLLPYHGSEFQKRAMNWHHQLFRDLEFTFPTDVYSSATPFVATISDIPAANVFRVWNHNTAGFQTVQITNYDGSSVDWNRGGSLHFTTSLDELLSGSPPQSGTINFGLSIQNVSLAEGADYFDYFGSIVIQNDAWKTATPSITLGGGSTGITYSATSGANETGWHENGRIVTFTSKITLTSKGTDTGSLLIDLGIPDKRGDSGQWSFSMRAINGMITKATGNAFTGNGITLYADNAGGTESRVTFTDADIDNDFEIVISGSYVKAG